MVDVVAECSKLKLEKKDILLLRINTTLHPEYVEAVIGTLKEKFQWEGVMIVLNPGESLEKLDEVGKHILYKRLKQILRKGQ